MFSSSSSLVSGLLRPLGSSASTCRRTEASGPKAVLYCWRTTCNCSDTSDSLLLKRQQSPSFPSSTSQKTKEITLKTNCLLRFLYEAKELQWSKKISSFQIYIAGWLAFFNVYRCHGTRPSVLCCSQCLIAVLR